MLTSKLLHIIECDFALPDDFEGTLGEALMLLAQYRLEKEKTYETIDTRFIEPTTTYDQLRDNPDSKCSIQYFLCKLSEDRTKWENLNI